MMGQLLCTYQVLAEAYEDFEIDVEAHDTGHTAVACSISVEHDVALLLNNDKYSQNMKYNM